MYYLFYIIYFLCANKYINNAKLSICSLAFGCIFVQGQGILFYLFIIHPSPLFPTPISLLFTDKCTHSEYAWTIRVFREPLCMLTVFLLT